jgi:hypothetical protein
MDFRLLMVLIDFELDLLGIRELKLVEKHLIGHTIN